MTTVHVDPKSIDRLTATLTPELWRQPVADLIRDASAFALRVAQDGSQALGGISSTITAEVAPMGATVSTSHPGAVFMEAGRRAGAKLPPLDALVRYGGEAFLIARAVARRGIRGRFFMRKAADALERSELPRLANRALLEIGAKWEAAE